ncbi:MAG: hypothetical protein QXY51_01470, partial [Candidatus Bathyarchaeia archaeon]
IYFLVQTFAVFAAIGQAALGVLVDLISIFQMFMITFTIFHFLSLIKRMYKAAQLYKSYGSKSPKNGTKEFICFN